MQFRPNFDHVPEEVECILLVQTPAGRRACLAQLKRVIDGSDVGLMRVAWCSTWDGEEIPAAWARLAWSPMILPDEAAEDEAVV